MEPKFVEIEQINVIGMMSTFNDETKHNIPELWAQFGPRIFEITDKIDGPTYGVCFPANSQKENFEYMAAVAVESTDVVPDGMTAKTIPAHKFAVFTHQSGEGTLHNDLQKTVQYIWGTWLPNSLFERAQVPDFELYDDRFDPMTGTGELDIYIPIK